MIHRIGKIAALVLALTAAVAPRADAGPYASVYGGATYTPGSGGHINPLTPTLGNWAFLDSGPDVSNTGIAVGFATKVNASDASQGTRGLRWGPGIASPIELGLTGPINPSGPTDAEAVAVNAAGTAVGFIDAYNASGIRLGFRAAVWDPSGTPTRLNTTLTSLAYDINDSGQIVGHVLTNGRRGALWTVSGTGQVTETLLQPINTNNASGLADAVRINNNGTIVGSSYKYVSGTLRGPRAVRWDPGQTTPTELAILPGYDAVTTALSIPTALNDSGTIVGVGYVHTGPGPSDPRYERAVRWDAGGTAITELGRLSTEGGNAAFDIASDGTIVGASQKFSGSTDLGIRAVLWRPNSTTAIELELLGTDPAGVSGSWAFGISDMGFAVGYADAYDDFGTLVGRRAVMWDMDGEITDLNDLIDPLSGWTLKHAYAVSDTGWITGIGTYDPDGVGGQDPYDRLFLIQAPEPGSAIALLGLTTITLLRRRRFR